MDKIEINLGDEQFNCNKMIATVKSDEHTNMLEQLVAGNWTLGELITAKSNFENILEQQIYKSLSPQQQSLLDNIEEKEQEMQEALLQNLTAEEKELYHQIHNLSLNSSVPHQKINESNTKQSNSAKQSETTNETENKVVNLNEYRSSN